MFSTQSLFDDIVCDGPILVAVSGGSDSVALLLLAHSWSLKSKAHLQAVTVDHGLRPEAAAEAAFVASLCAGLGVPHVTLAWEGIKPSFGIQEAARQSRYSLMDDFAHEIGADIILTGHTRDDQAETIMMRALRSVEASDGRGLSSMGRKTWLYGGTKLMRPLLNHSRRQLRGYLSQMAQPWIEDPSNLDRSYERVRIRDLLREDKQLEDRLHRLGNLSGRFRKQLALSVAQELENKVVARPGPVFEASGFSAENPISTQAIQVLIAMAGGQLYLVSKKRLGAVIDLANGSAQSTKVARANIGGAIVERKGDKLLFYRETRNLSSLLLDPDEAAIWDGRMHIYNGTALPVFIEAASRQQLLEFEAAREEPYPVMPRAALRSTPIVHIQTQNGETMPCLPLVESSKLPKGLEIRLASPAIEHFCPDFDAALRDWVRSLDQYPAASLQP